MSDVIYDAGNMTIELSGLESVKKELGKLKQKTPAATKVALNAAARYARRTMIAQAKARYAVTEKGEKHLKDLVQRRRATNRNLMAELYINAYRNDLAYFEHSPTETFTGGSVNSAPEYVKAHVLRSTSMKNLTGTGRLSKGFLVEFSNKHIGMVQRVINSHSKYTITRKSNKPRWRNAKGNVEKMRTMGSPSATGMHNTVWKEVEADIEDYLLDRLEKRVQRILEKNGGNA